MAPKVTTPKKMANIVHKFPIGAAVRITHPSSADPRCKTGIVLRHESYLGRPGYYVSYPDATEQWHCQGGWVPEHLVEPLA